MNLREEAQEATPRALRCYERAVWPGDPHD